MAQSCVSLATSTQCSAFNASSISTDSTLTGLFPFLADVSDTASFDQHLEDYVSGSFVQQRYENLLGCTNINLDNTTDVYARYTTSVLCNAIVQNSIDACNLTSDASKPLCADTCADYAISEQKIVASSELCGANSSNINTQIRADFTNCALPADSLTGSCIHGIVNEPDNCGYSSNLVGLCSYCASSSPNSTDSCCINSEVDSRCEDVTLPTTSTMAPLFPSSTSSSGSSATGDSKDGEAGHGLSAGQIAGIVIGSILGAALLLSLIIFACLLMRRRRNQQAESIFNRPSPSRGTAVAPMSYADVPPPMPPPTGRVARMSALEDTSSSDHYDGPVGVGTYHHHGSDGSTDSPRSRTGRSAVVAAGRLPKREGSLSSASRLAIGNDPSSPESTSNEEHYSPDGVNSGQSEQLPFFKDYYSQDEIKPNDIVATLWAYQPRANDEFELERGDMIKVVGIWDDGWATGVKLQETADDWDESRKWQRDSGMSSGSRHPNAALNGEIKAFPLVCVCLPQHWRKTIEGDSPDAAMLNSP
ncbi:uncharacterized protein K452DRAFT_295193 [Aplosporella prunicola CBS 121167]|uniref:SH3 domain-containing protein n=1 Tax=Aplosporella prunicola CBS 121167 TaxID=1176127 RepID=A0A6A6BRY8_9PEZI|nr:uncharacterized protein K452DRAFT_295193 [Aplosporella prunicola CBS 121167]KAF2145587.1 hypothetical protein K452DRAFT_295193 [Aplosporella prunicola CBS 121167]